MPGDRRREPGRSLRIAVVGAGAIGGYFGAMLARSGNEVFLVARGEHLATLKRAGLHVKSVTGDVHLQPAGDGVHATDDTAAIGPVDIVLFCVKSYDTSSAAGSLRPLLGPDTAVISLQNGIDNEEKIAGVIGQRHVMGGVAFIFARLAGPGLVHHTGGPRRIIFGELDGTRSQRAEAFLAACQAAGFPAEISTDIRAAMWSKFAFICAQAGLTSATRMPIGVLRDVPESMALFRDVLSEACDVGRAEGASLPDDLVEQHLAFVQQLEADGRSSLHDDMVSGRRMELDALLGELVRRGERSAVATPASGALLAILRPWQIKNAAPS